MVSNALLVQMAKNLVSDGKGILAADESFPTIEKRFRANGIEVSEENRRSYRELLFTSSEIEKFVSGVILFDETFRQAGSDGRKFVTALIAKGIAPGIKVDKGAVAFPGSPAEFLTEGFDGLRGRLAEYAKEGIKFTKWRAVISLQNGHVPTEACVLANANALACYAAFAQEAGLVPIVEPEVLMDGNHDIDRCLAATDRTLEHVFSALRRFEVDLSSIVLKPNMVISGSSCPRQASSREIAEKTLACLLRNVPAVVPGIAFLSGGQKSNEAAANLRAINELARGAPWRLTYSFGRALQDRALSAWRGERGNWEAAQRTFDETLRAASVAASSNGQ